MNPQRTYEYLHLARTRVLQASRSLDLKQHTAPFEMGMGTLGETLTHIMICEWAYVKRIAGEDVPPYDQWIFDDRDPPPLAELENAWATQAERTREVIAQVQDWDTPFEFRGHWENRDVIVTASRADVFTQLVLHEVHHRAQAMNMLRRLGAPVEELDFNTMMYSRRDA